MGGSGGKRRPIVEDIWRIVFAELELAVEGPDLVPCREHSLLLSGKIDAAHPGLSTVRCDVKRRFDVANDPGFV